MRRRPTRRTAACRPGMLGEHPGRPRRIPGGAPPYGSLVAEARPENGEAPPSQADCRGRPRPFRLADKGARRAVCRFPPTFSSDAKRKRRAYAAWRFTAIPSDGRPRPGWEGGVDPGRPAGPILTRPGLVVYAGWPAYPSHEAANQLADSARAAAARRPGGLGRLALTASGQAQDDSERLPRPAAAARGAISLRLQDCSRLGPAAAEGRGAVPCRRIDLTTLAAASPGRAQRIAAARSPATKRKRRNGRQGGRP